MGFVANAVSSIVKPVAGVFGAAGQAMSVQDQYQAQLLNAQAQQQQQANNIGVQQSNLTQEQQLAQQLQAQANGTGPNPSQSQYGQNISNAANAAAAQVGSTKGLNSALAARLAAQQQSASGQNAAANAATLQAQQQLASQQALQNQQNMIGGQALTAQQTVNNAQAGTQGINAGVAATNTQSTNQMTGGILGAAGSALSLGGKKAMGGVMMKDGGDVPGHALFKGDTEKNDTVNAELSPGEVVIPRTIAKNPDKAKKFIEHLKKHKGGDLKTFKKALASKKKGKAS